MTSFTNVFGGGTINPAFDSYTSYTLTANLALVWPLETAPNSNLAAQIMDVSVATAASFGLILPPANQVSVGQFLIVNNKSAFNQAIFDNSGATIIAAIAPGAIYFLYVVNNTTAAGVWSTFQYGAQASAPNVSALAGPGLLAIGATLAQDIVVVSIGTNFIAGLANRTQLLNWTGGTGTITLPLANTVGASFYIQVRNSGTSILTVPTSGSDLVNGVSSVAFNPGDSAFIVTDGVAWYTIGLGPAILANFGFIIINVPAVVVGGIVTLTGTQLNQVAYKFTGALTQNTIVDLPPIKQQYWIDNATTGAFTLLFQIPTVAGGPTPAGATVTVSQGINGIFYTDGTNVINAVSGSALGNPVLVGQGGTGATTAGQALINLGGTSQGIGLFTSASQAAAQTAIAAPSTADAVVFSLVF
jgi:hypothetical protein